MTMSSMTMSSMMMVVMAGAMAVTVTNQLMQMVMQNTTVTNTALKPGHGMKKSKHDRGPNGDAHRPEPEQAR